MEQAKVSICIATYNMSHLISQTLCSCLNQNYGNLEIIVYDDCGTDDTEFQCIGWEGDVKYFKGKVNVGVGVAFNEAVARASGEFIILMCADDVFTNQEVIRDVVNLFESDSFIGHVSRYYYQFIDGKPYDEAVRAWRGDCPLMLASNPSGLAFRRSALEGNGASSRMFVETAVLVSRVLSDCWHYKILPYDAIAVRVHDSTSTQKGYWLKRRKSSPVLDWYGLGCINITKDYCSLIQIKCNYKLSAVLEEICNFIKLRPTNVLQPMFVFYVFLSILMPRKILRALPHWYRKYIGKLVTRRINRP